MGKLNLNFEESVTIDQFGKLHTHHEDYWHVVIIYHSKSRISTPLLSLSLFLLVIATIFALISYYSSIDYRTIVACGLFILAGLSLGSGLFVYAVTVSDTYLSTSSNHNTKPELQPELKRHHQYEFSYGWCFFTAGLALLLSELSIFFLIMAYTKRFTTVEQMVYKTIPGAKRKLNEIMVAMRSLQPDVGREVNNKLIKTRQDSRRPERKIEPENECGTTATPDLCATNEQLQHLLDKKQTYSTLQNHLKTQSISTYPQLSCYYQHQQLQHPYHNQNHHHHHHHHHSQHRHHRNYNTIQIPKQKASVRFVNVLPTHRNDDDDDEDDQGSAV